MTITSVSSATLSGILSNSVSRMQSQMVVLETENTTGRLADVGLSLGAGSGAVIVLHQQMADLDSLTSSNAMVTTQLDTAANALTNLQKVSSGVLSQSIMGSSVAPQSTGAMALAQAASGALNTFTSMANANTGGTYVFGGQNTGSAAMESYTPNVQAAVQDAFYQYFGFHVDDTAQVNAISSADMTGFLNSSQFTDLFSANWSGATGVWSNASSTALSNRVSTNQTITTSITANDPAFRNMAQGLTMLSEFGGLNLNASAYATLVTAAQSVLNTGNNQMIEAAAAVGTMQNTVSQATSAISLQQDVLTQQINAKETVDSYKVATEVTALSNQLQVAYSLTSQLHKLSLVNFL